MAMTWVSVVRSDGGGVGDEFFIDGNFAERGGRLGTPFHTNSGQHTFQVVDAKFTPLFEKTQVVLKTENNSDDNPIIVTLEPV